MIFSRRHPRKFLGLGRALSASSGAALSQNNPYQTNLVIDLAPWSTFYPNANQTGTPVTANGASVKSAQNRASGSNYLAETLSSPSLVDDASGPGGLRFLRLADKPMQAQSALATAGFWFACVCKAEYTATALRVLLASVAATGDVTSGGWWFGVDDGDGSDTFALANHTAAGTLAYFGRTGSYPNTQWAIVTAGYQASSKDYSLNRVDQTPYDNYLGLTGSGAHTPSAVAPILGFNGTHDVQFLQLYDALPSAENRQLVVDWLADWTEIA